MTSFSAQQQSQDMHSASKHSATPTEGVHPTFGLRSVAEQPAAEQQLETVSKIDLYAERARLDAAIRSFLNKEHA